MYVIHAYSPSGGAVRKVTRFSSLTMARSENSIGALDLQLPLESNDIGLFTRDTVLAVENENGNLEFETVWFVRKFQRNRMVDRKSYSITAYDTLYLLGSPENNAGRAIPYESDNATYTDLLDFADDMLKTLMSQNIGIGALDADRDLSKYIHIDPISSKGPIVAKDCSKALLLPVMQEICDTAAGEGTRVMFDLVVTSIPKSMTDLSMQFRTYIGNRGANNTGLVIGTDNGTMSDSVYIKDYTEEITYAYAWGNGEGALRDFEEAGSGRAKASPFNRREHIVDARDISDSAKLLDEAYRALNKGRPKVSVSGKIVDMPENAYGIDWKYGDAITIKEDDLLIPGRVQAVTISVDRNNARSVEAEISGEMDVV